MADALGDSVTELVAFARRRLAGVATNWDTDSDRSIVEITGYWESYRVIIKETHSSGLCRYAYYVLHDDSVLFGFDNYPDRQALRLKYGRTYIDHLHELVPHRHGRGKQDVRLTEPWTGIRFLAELEELILDLERSE